MLRKREEDVRAEGFSSAAVREREDEMRLDLNDLLNRNKEEKKKDKLRNLYIVAATGTFAVLALLLINFISS